MGSREHVTTKRPTREASTTISTNDVEPTPEPAVEAADLAAVAPLAGLAYQSAPSASPMLRRANPHDPMGDQLVPAEVQDTLQRRAGQGAALPADVGAAMSEQLGTDLSNVRVHADAESDRISRSVAATAFTHGSDIYFSQGAYDPTSAGGQHLLAHELSHVVQQRAGRTGTSSSAGPTIGRADDPLESEADRMATGVVSALRRQATRAPATSAGTSAQTAPSTATLRRSAVIQRETTTKTTTEDDVTKTVTKNEIHVGKKSKGGSESDTFDGTTHKTASTKAKGMAGAEAYSKRITEASDDEIKETIEFLARAGAFGEVEAKAAIERGKLSAKASAKASGGAGASASGKAGTSKSGKGLQTAVEAFLEFQASVGVGGEASAEAEVAFGPLAIAAMAKVAAFAGARVAVKGKAFASLAEGIGAEGSAEAMAGAEASGSASITVKLGDAEVAAEVKGEAFAGVSASAKGKASIGLQGVEVSAAAEAFAGVKATAKAKGTISFGGQTILKAKGSVEASAGVGGKAKGTFSFKNGVLVIEGELAGALGIGGGVEVGVEIDFVALAMAIDKLITDYFFKEQEEINRNSPAVERVPMLDPNLKVKYRKLGYETMIGDFQAYGAKKAKQGDSGIKRERVQKMLDFRYAKLKDAYVALETDAGIMQAAKDAFGDQLIYIDVQAGQIRSFQAKKKDGQAAKELAKIGKANGW